MAHDEALQRWAADDGWVLTRLPSSVARLGRRLVGRLEVAQVERFGTSAVALAARTPVLVLHTTGRRTALERRHVLARAAEQGGSWLVVGGAAGQRRMPDWVANLRAEPRAWVTVGRRRVAVRAVELTGAERAEAWDRLRRVWPRIDLYQRRAGRPVPVVRLVPTASDDAGVLKAAER